MFNPMLRGGRITKYKGEAASFAPDSSAPPTASILSRATSFLGSSVSARAFALALAAAAPLTLTGTGAQAGVCTETFAGSGIWVCTGAAGADVTQNLTSAAGGALVATTDPLFGITTAAGDAINLRNAAGDTNITFTDSNISTITGADDGIDANNIGSGFLTITTNGAVTGTTIDGIFARNSTAGTSLTINAQGTVMGGNLGIYARNSGSGALSITTQAVTSTTLDGILAESFGTSLTINAQDAVMGNGEGIDARNLGSGALSITTQAVTSTTDNGIFARNGSGVTPAGTSLTITTNGAVLGGTDGIDTVNYGTAGLTINVNGNVTGGAGQGINAYNSANDVTASMVINQAAGTVTTGALNGIFANNFGGSLTINALGTSIGTAGDGIYADNNVGTTNLTILANNATGGDDGIDANNNGTGALSITTTGAITGTTRYGIFALNSSGAGTDLTINAQGAVMGGARGIDAINFGSGTLSITSSAPVTGGTSYGINTLTNAGGMTVITLNAGAAVSSTAGLGIYNGDGNSTTTVNGGASVAGTITLGDGSDDLSFAGGDFSGVTLFDGGDDISPADTFIDTLTFAGSSGAVTGANVVNWENVVIGVGSTISFSDNMLTTGVLMTNAGGTLEATGGTLTITADMVNNGTINAQDGAADDRIVVTGNYTGTGTLRVDVNLATDTADVLAVGGNITGGTTTINGNFLLPNAATGNNILVVDVTGTSNAGDFALGNPFSGALAYSLSQIGVDWFLRQTGFNPAVPTYEAYPQVLQELNTLSTLRRRRGNRAENAGAAQNSGFGNAGAGFGYAAAGGGNGHANQPGPVWARLEGARSVVDSATSTTGSSFDVDRWKLQAGIDALIQDGPDGTWLFGLNAFYSMADADISSVIGNGSITTEGGGLGLTTTWYGGGGYYVDGQAQISWFGSDLDDAASGLLVRNNRGMGYAVSLEAGRRLAMGDGWTATPQVQLVYSSIDFDRFTGPNSDTVTLDDDDSVRGRIGLDLDRQRRWTAQDGTASSSQIYGLANLYYEFSGESQVDVSGTRFINQPDRLSGEIGVGGSHSWDDDTYALFGEVSTATSLENFGDSYQFKGTAGIRIRF